MLSSLIGCTERSEPSYNSKSDSQSLSAPTELSATKTSSYITLSWNKVQNAKKYLVYRASSFGGSYVNLTSVYLEQYTDQQPLNGNNCYKVSAIDANGNESNYSSVCTIYYSSSSSPSSPSYDDTPSSPSSTLSAPTNVQVSKEGPTLYPYMYITWNNVNGAVKFNIYRASSASGSYSLIGTAYNTSYSDDNPLSGNNYYKVTAVNSSGKESSKSSYASASNDKNAVSPCPPTLSGSASGYNATLRWSYSNSYGCGTPTKVIVKYYDCKYTNKWYEYNTYSASTTSCTIPNVLTYVDEYGWVKLGIIVENDYGTASKTINYNPSTKQWLTY